MILKLFILFNFDINFHAGFEYFSLGIGKIWSASCRHVGIKSTEAASQGHAFEGSVIVVCPCFDHLACVRTQTSNELAVSMQYHPKHLLSQVALLNPKSLSKCKKMKRNRSHHSNIFWKVTTVYPCNMSWRDTKQVKTVFNNEEDTFGELCAGIPKYSNPCDFWLVQNRKWNYQVLYHLFGVMKPISDDTFMF